MKKIEAIIRSSKFEAVKESLSNIGVDFFTFMEVKGFGRQAGEHVVYRGAVYDIGYIARQKLEIIATDDKIEDIISAIREAAQTGEIGDGKIILSNVEQMISIRTGEKDAKAL
jgi:nitrogen regulatory protein PII